MFKCLDSDCGKSFQYTAKMIETTETPTKTETEIFAIERHVCPHCGSLEFAEVSDNEVIISVKSVTIEEVDECLKQGYIVKELYAKTATLIKIKKEEKKEVIQNGQ